MGDLLDLLGDAAAVTTGITNAVAPAVMDAGMALWRGLALIVVVWTGIQMALAGGGLNMATVVRTVIGLSIPLGMLRFYSTPLPGTGRTIPDLITGMGEWLHDLLVADAGRTMLVQMQAAFTAFANRLGEQGLFGDGDNPGWMAVITRLPALVEAAFDLVVTIVLMTVLAIGMVLVWSLGQAQVMWAQLALAMALLLGPVFVPWIVVPQLAWLFWGWLRTILIYSLYAAVAATVFRIMSELGVAVVNAWTGSITDTNVTWTGVTGLVRAGTQTVVTVPYLVAAGLASAKVGELTQLLVLGGGNLGSNAGQAMRAVRTVRGGA